MYVVYGQTNEKNDCIFQKTNFTISVSGFDQKCTPRDLSGQLTISGALKVNAQKVANKSTVSVNQCPVFKRLFWGRGGRGLGLGLLGFNASATARVISRR